MAVAGRDASRSRKLTAEAFEAAQLDRASSVGAAVSRMAARFATGTDALARTVRGHQDAVIQWRKADAALFKLVAAPPNKRNAARQKNLRKQLAALDGKITALSGKLATEFAEYTELATPRPVALKDVRKLLGSNEALMAYLVSDKKTFVWVVRRDRAEVFTVDVGRKALKEAVKELRGALDPAGVMRLADIPPFNRTKAHELFKLIFAPAEKLLDGVRHVFMVPDGALQSLPLGMLVTDEPQGAITDFAGYRQVPWLARKYAMTTLPTVSSLRALRTFARRARARIPFTGFGDPLLNGHPGGSRGVRLASLFRGAIANVDAVRNLAPLPGTADELRALSAAVKGDPKRIYLRKSATERMVKSLDLSDSRIIAFATHGLVAGDLKFAEPALVLTPPDKGTALDDGLLTAGEVAQLKLNADLVILSACNTAAADDADGAEGLSGLAKAFFYAGSRALLVSHWPVVSDAAVKLTTAMLKATARDPAIGRAEALRRSMLALMEDKKIPTTPIPCSGPRSWWWGKAACPPGIDPGARPRWNRPLIPCPPAWPAPPR